MKPVKAMDHFASLINGLPQPWPQGVSLLKWQDLVAPLRSVELQSIVLAEGIQPGELVASALQYSLQHVCQLGNPFSEQEVLTAALMLSDPKEALKNPFATILEPKNFMQVRDQNFVDFEREFESLIQKPIWLEELKTFLDGKLKSESLKTEILSIIDELYTNVIFNAPFVTAENPMPQMDRGASNKLPKMPQKAKIKISVRDDSILLGCEDYFGSLIIEKLLKKISCCYEKGVEQSISMGSAGAGIGSYMVYEASASYYLFVSPGVKTVIVCRLPIKMSSRARQALNKNIHFLQG